MLSYNEQFQIALELAVEKHKNQTDKAGNPYILHPLHVMENVKSKEGKIVAILHDIIEDTDVTEDIKSRSFKAYCRCCCIINSI